MKGTELIKRGVLSNYLHNLAGFGWVILLTPIILKFLGPMVYGYWAILTSLVSYFTLFNFGLLIATAKYTAEYRAKNDGVQLNKLVSSTLVAVIVLGIVLLFVSFVVSPFVPRLFNLTEELSATGKIAFILTGFNVGLMLLAGVFGNIIYGLHRVDVWQLLRTAQLLAYAVLTIAFLYLGWNLIGVLLALTASQFILIFLFRQFLKRDESKILILFNLASFKKLKEIAPYSIRSFALGLSNCILHYTSFIIIGVFLGAAMVTPYEIVFKLCFMATYLFSAISTTLFPKFAELYARDDMERLRKLFLYVSKLSLAIMTPLALCLLFFGFDFIKLWVGEENFAGYPVLVTLVIMTILHAVGTTSGVLLQSIGKNKGFMYSELVHAALNLIITLILVRMIGLLGVALGVVIANFLTTFWTSIYLLHKHIGLRVIEYIRVAILAPIFVGLLSGGIMWIIFDRLPRPSGWLSLSLNGMIMVVLYVILYLLVGVNKEERKICWSFIMGSKNIRNCENIVSDPGDL